MTPLQPRSEPGTRLPLAGYPILSIDAAALAGLLRQRLQGEQKTVLAFANTHLVMRCQHLRPWLCTDEVVLVNDGIGVDLAAYMKYGHMYQENLNGTDFVPYLLQSLSPPRRIFLYGSKPEVVQRAAEVIAGDTLHTVVGFHDGYTPIAPVDLQAMINRSGAELVLVGLGNPLQEEWTYRHRHGLHASLFINVGALFDFLSHHVKRAPRWVQRIRCEWLYRFSLEPRRMARRYTVDLLRFFALCRRFPRWQIGNPSERRDPV
jgi:beta-1,4-glucosyltransferase